VEEIFVTFRWSRETGRALLCYLIQFVYQQALIIKYIRKKIQK